MSNKVSKFSSIVSGKKILIHVDGLFDGAEKGGGGGTEIAAAHRGQKADGPRPNSFRH